jgi:hypothetical protein
MTNQHPATPTSQEIDKFFMLPLSEEERLTAAFCAGADQKLEACIQLLDINGCPGKWIDMLRAARRPKPPTLAEQAKAELDDAVMRGDCITTTDAMPYLRRAIQRLAELEKQITH